jgi:hypothetical protein
VRIGAFELNEPIPELNGPYVFATLHPWIDVNNVGSLVLNGLETQFGAEGLGRLAQPGNFFDFTRYRPTVYFHGDIRQLKIPNTTLSYARREKGNDFLFLRMLEPHSLGEDYVDSVMELFKVLRVKRYCLLGSMYDAVPHTKPLLVSGRASGKDAEQDLKRAGVQSSNYQGPTTITYLITQKAPEIDMQTTTFIVSLPQYVNTEEDYLGKVRLIDFKVRVLPAGLGTASQVRVLIESTDGRDQWATVGVSDNIIEASWQALIDSIDYKLYKDRKSRRK